TERRKTAGQSGLPAAVPCSPYCPPCQQKYAKGNRDRRKQDLREKALLAVGVRLAITDSIDKNQEKENREAEHYRY
ncbi:hypothetical protein AB9U18_25760, partial [Novosphingobium sp. NRRL B-2648]|uniref:hypothetical protein n=1 Tax=Novosphingobium sp. NRRL B-2648 TaxID=3230802 RepID=UPI003514FDE2